MSISSDLVRNQHRSKLSKISVLILYLAFAGTGIGMALPGAVLPALQQKWALSDGRLGLFFLLGWMGSSVGALMVGPSRSRSAATGCVLVALGLLGMALATGSRWWAPLLSMLLYGLGLGLGMTSISLLRSAQSSERRSAELNRLNLVWAIGASSCPILTAHALRVADIRGLFSALATMFLFSSFWIWRLKGEVAPSAQATKPPAGQQSRGLSNTPGLNRRLLLWPVSLVLAVMLPTGIESSMGGWAASYVFRMQHAWSTTISAGTCFWVGLMVSRLLSSAILRYRNAESWVLVQSLLTVIAGLSLLNLGASSAVVLSGIFIVGMGLGPVYPLLLAMALAYSENTMIFFAAGVGSAVLPWLTGLVSGANNSLRAGLLVPLFGSVIMLLLGMRQIRNAKVEAG